MIFCKRASQRDCVLRRALISKDQLGKWGSEGAYSGSQKGCLDVKCMISNGPAIFAASGVFYAALWALR